VRKRIARIFFVKYQSEQITDTFNFFKRVFTVEMGSKILLLQGQNKRKFSFLEEIFWEGGIKIMNNTQK
jgi:hypothetical protein